MHQLLPTQISYAYHVQAFSLCEALLDLRSTNPGLYREITSGYQPLPSSSIVGDEPEFPEDEGLYDGTVDEVYVAVLDARSSGEVAPGAPVNPEEESESEYDYESEDDHAPPASGPRIVSRRHGGMNWDE